MRSGYFMVTIQSRRLTLRELNKNDLQEVHSYASDPEVVRYMDWGPNTKEETKAFIRRTLSSQKDEPRHKFTLAITLKREGSLIGGCGLNITSLKDKVGWLGYCLNRHFWHRGYATETAEALIEFGFQKLGLHRLSATVDPNNIASQRVLEKIGMQREGHLREHRWTKGEWRDSLVYAILENEWKKKK